MRRFVIAHPSRNLADHASRAVARVPIKLSPWHGPQPVRLAQPTLGELRNACVSLPSSYADHRGRPRRSARARQVNVL
jgi:hypothetical protein